MLNQSYVAINNNQFVYGCIYHLLKIINMTINAPKVLNVLSYRPIAVFSWIQILWGGGIQATFNTPSCVCLEEERERVHLAGKLTMWTLCLFPAEGHEW